MSIPSISPMNFSCWDTGFTYPCQYPFGTVKSDLVNNAGETVCSTPCPQTFLPLIYSECTHSLVGRCTMSMFYIVRILLAVSFAVSMPFVACMLSCTFCVVFELTISRNFSILKMVTIDLDIQKFSLDSLKLQRNNIWLLFSHWDPNYVNFFKTFLPMYVFSCMWITSLCGIF